MIRVAVARVHILIIVSSRLRRPETDGERAGGGGKGKINDISAPRLSGNIWF